MCDAYEINRNPYTINYEEMFNIILQNIHKGFIVDVNVLFLVYLFITNKYLFKLLILV